MRVLHLGKFFPPVHGGIETVTRDLADGLAGRNVDVTVLAFSRDPESESRGDAERPYGVLRARARRVVASMPLSLEYCRWMHRQLASADIVHVHVPNPLATIALWLFKPRARIVVHWHSDIVRQRVLLIPFLPFQRWMLRRADAIITASPPYADSSPALAPVRQKVAVIPYGVQPLPPADDTVNLPDGLQVAGRKTVLAIGRLVYYKGFETLVEAARWLPAEYQVLIVGDGPLRGRLQGLIDAVGCSGRVRLLGRLSDAQIGALMRQATVFCLPSIERSEAFGVVQVEAMRAGVPVVATRIPGSGTSWVNADGDSGLNVEVGDARGLADALRALADDEAIRQAYSQRARRRYETLFSVAQMTASVLAVYRRVLGRDDGVVAISESAGS